MFRDSLDQKFDFSRVLLEAKGFIPLVFFVTEPALGGFGATLVPLFITPKKGGKLGEYTPPSLTGAFGMYTSNGSWAVGGLHAGSIPSKGIKYRVGLALLNANIDFYRDLPGLGEQKFSFEIRATPILLNISKRIIQKQPLYAGLQYIYNKATVEPQFAGGLPGFVDPKDLVNQTASLGVFLDLDKRNTIFTPDKGFAANLGFNTDQNWTGSDFSFHKLSGNFNYFLPVSSRWVSGFRAESQAVIGKTPFYLLPSVNLRGIPALKYQGKQIFVVETEQRYDWNPRWSAVAFVGGGYTIAASSKLANNQFVYNAGGGFRYLIARAFKIRTGVDVAVGPGSWGWYIVFGHNWNR